MKSRRKKKHRPVTETKIRTASTTSNKVISKLHVLNKEIEKSRNAGESRQKILVLKRQVEELGGLNAYQSASKRGEARHGNLNSAKWVLRKLDECNVRREEGCKLTLLDVGALDDNYTKQRKWIECTAIDLNPQSSRVLKADFFTFQAGESVQYDIIVLSLVLNFLGSPSKRGDMLKRCCQLCKPLGHLFVVLPRACLENARYLNQELFVNILGSLGFELVASHSSRKLSFFMFQLGSAAAGPEKAWPKTMVRNGTKCNNFSIVLNI